MHSLEDVKACYCLHSPRAVMVFPSGFPYRLSQKVAITMTVNLPSELHRSIEPGVQQGISSPHYLSARNIYFQHRVAAEIWSSLVEPVLELAMARPVTSYELQIR